MNSDKIKEAAEKYAEKKSFRKPYDGSTSFQDDKIYDCANDSFDDGALSDAAKEYWFAQFQSQQKQTAVWVVKSYSSQIADTGDYYVQFSLENESAGKNLFLSSDDEEDYFEMADYLNSTPQPQLSESEIEKLAEKEYPQGGMCKSQLVRAFIKGYKSAQTQPKKQLPDVSGGTCANGVDCGCTTESHKTCFIPNRTSIDQILHDLEEYFDDRMDADEGVPNKEMNLFGAVQKLKTLLK